MKTRTKSAIFYPLLSLLLAVMAIAGLIFAPTHLELADDPVQSPARQPDNFVEAEAITPASPNAADPQPSVSFAQENNNVARSAAVPSSVRTAQPASPVPFESPDVEAVTTDSESSGNRSSIAAAGASFLGDPSAKPEEIDSAVGAAQGSELVIPVPPGEKVPALFLDENPRPVPQQKMLDRIAAEFNEAVSNPPPGVSEEEAWEQARLNADEKYLKLFGYAAYNAYHLQAAKEAVREKQGLQSLQPPEQ